MPNRLSPNQLSSEKSPYLRQHADNPVDWMPWGDAAFEKARREDKPIFLSIGYSTCHWCHVMAHESFEDTRTAEVLNQYFVPVKLDREERPDIDRIYMLFVQATTGSGGWPMSVWLTPELRPFFGGTYFPPDTRYGRPGFRDLLQHLAKAWQQDRGKIDESSVSVTAQLHSMSSPGNASQPADATLFQSAFWQFRRAFDSRNGGFGAAPKFPRPVALIYLLRYFALERAEEAIDMVVKTLDAMADGGMHDQLGGGFHRYSVDEHWFVPHFEKMLYDQAQLAIAYLEAFQITARPEFAAVCRSILDYVLRDLTGPEGAFYSAEDADSADPEDPQHHGEGAFYIWRRTEIDALLGPDAAEFCRYYGVEADGNVENDPQGEFTGRNILFRAGKTPDTEALQKSRQKLLAARAQRPRPHLDNKVLTAWNGLMISAFARAGAVLDEPRYVQAAEHSADFFLSRMYQADSGLLLRRYCDGEAAIPGFADDYAFFAIALLDLFEVCGEARYLQIAVDLLRKGLSRFEDGANGGFFSTSEQAPDVLLRLKDDYDGAEPSANSAAIEALLRASHLTGNTDFSRAAERSISYFASRLKAQPTMAPQLLVALSRTLQSSEQTVVRCPALTEQPLQLLRAKQSEFRPYASIFPLTDAAVQTLTHLAPFLASLERKGAYTLFNCRNFTCDLPLSF